MTNKKIALKKSFMISMNAQVYVENEKLEVQCWAKLNGFTLFQKDIKFYDNKRNNP